MRGKHKYEVIHARESIGSITFEYRGFPIATTPTTWKDLGVIAIYLPGWTDTKLVHLYLNSRKDIVFEHFVSGYFYPLHGKVVATEGVITFSAWGKQYQIIDCKLSQLKGEQQ